MSNALQTDVRREALTDANRQLLRKLAAGALLMFGFGFALVPFYEQICEATGMRNILRPDHVTPKNTQVVATRTVGIEFDSGPQRLGWTLKPLSPHLSVHPGEVITIEYEIRNTLDRPVTGQAIPAYGPQNAASYFKKLECFCFTQQTLGPGEARRMPVVFVVDPELPDHITAITLSYTFFEVAGAPGRRG